MCGVQNQREVTLAGFRSGKFPVLVATDVAARGLDITGVELVVQCEPPKDPETYIHRSAATTIPVLLSRDTWCCTAHGFKQAPRVKCARSRLLKTAVSSWHTHLGGLLDP